MFTSVLTQYALSIVKNWFRICQTILNSETNLMGKLICDLGCGQGELANDLNNLGGKVTGVDFSKKLLEYAQSLTDQVTWVQGDAMALPPSFQNESFDIVVSSLMFMDVADHKAVFNESNRILKPGGVMIWMIMHPCFQSPFCLPLEDGSRKVFQYSPQFWKSNGKGTLRSILGSYHRPISQYLNDFMKAGFVLEQTFEPGSEISAQPNEHVLDIPDHFGAIGWKR